MKTTAKKMTMMTATKTRATRSERALIQWMIKTTQGSLRLFFSGS